VGKVELDIKIHHEKLGNMHVKGEYPRIIPRVAPQDVPIGILETNLMRWVETHFETASKPKYYKDVVNAAVLLTVYMDPWADLQSKTMDLGCKFVCWCWISDDLLEEAVKHEIPYEEIQEETGKLLQIMSFEPNFNLISSTGGFFKELYGSLKSLGKLFWEIIPDYNSAWHTLREFTKKYYAACNFFTICPGDKMCSEEMFSYWKNICFFCDGTVIFFLLIHRITLPLDFLKSPVITRMFDVLNSYGALVNDVVGIKKDVEEGTVNLILFQMSTKGISLETAVNEALHKVEQTMREYMVLRSVISKTHPENPSIDKFLHLLDCFMDAQNRLFAACTRYGDGVDEGLKLIP